MFKNFNVHFLLPSFWIYLILAALGLNGCAQEDKSKVNSDADQKTIAPIGSRVNDKTTGTSIVVTNNFNYNPANQKVPPKSATSQPVTTEVMTVSSDASGNRATGAREQVQDGLTFIYTFTTGGTAPSIATGAQTANATGTQNPQTNPTKDQKQDPTASIVVPIAMPLGQATGSGQAAGPQGTTSGAQTQTPTQKNGLTAQGAIGLQATNQGGTPIDSSGQTQSAAPSQAIAPPTSTAPAPVSPSDGHN